MTRAKAKAKVEFEPEINVARNGSYVSGSDQAADYSALLDDSTVKQKQKFTESGEGNQTIKQRDVQEEVVDPG